MDAHEQHRRPVGDLQAFDLGERLQSFPGEPFGEQRQERGDGGCRGELVERVDDELLDGLGSEDAVELALESRRGVADEVLLIEREVVEVGAVHHQVSCGVEESDERERDRAPISCMTMNIGADDGLMPAKLSDIVRAIVTAGLAKLVDDVKK